MFLEVYMLYIETINEFINGLTTFPFGNEIMGVFPII